MYLKPSQSLHQYVEEYMKHYDCSHRIDHIYRVSHMAWEMFTEENKNPSYSDARLLILCCYLHDIIDYSGTPRTPTKFPQELTDILISEEKLTTKEVKDIENICLNVSFSKRKKGNLTLHAYNTNIWKYVCDADILDDMGIIGIARCFAFAGSQPKLDIQTARKHFDEQLLKLKDYIITEVAKPMANRRYHSMVAFLQEFDIDNKIE